MWEELRMAIIEKFVRTLREIKDLEHVEYDSPIFLIIQKTK